MSSNPIADRRVAALEAFLAADPNDAFSRYALALEWRSRGDTANAIEQLEELRRRDPNYLALYYVLGVLYAQAGRHDEARNIYVSGIALARVQGDTHTLSELNEAMENDER